MFATALSFVNKWLLSPGSYRLHRNGFLLLLMAVSLAHGDAKISCAQTAQELIKTLCSPNVRPMREYRDRDQVDIIYAPGYDHQAQKKVEAAWDALFTKGDEAIPYLVESFHDDQYSVTAIFRTGRSNWSVGFVCQTIFQTQIEVYEPFVPYEDRFKPYFVKGMGSPHGLQPEVFEKWWQEYQKMDLRELQIEAVQWAMKHERANGELSDGERAAVLSSLEAVLKRLESSKKPILIDHKGHFQGEDAQLYDECRNRVDQASQEARKKEVRSIPMRAAPGVGPPKSDVRRDKTTDVQQR